MRWPHRLAVLVAGVAAALTVANPSSGSPAHVDLDHAPSDFATVMGYTPVVKQLADGTSRLVNPHGGCSVPGEGKPFDFNVACQAHDYGYDLLRYSEKKGAEMPPSARDEMDERLTRDLSAQCVATTGHLASCDATVAVFQAGVAFNSWRQLSGPPIDQSGLARTSGLVLLSFLGIGFLVPGLRRLVNHSA